MTYGISGMYPLGGLFAVILSWIVNHSVGWCILHFFCSWIYVVYWFVVKTRCYDWLTSLVR